MNYNLRSINNQLYFISPNLDASFLTVKESLAPNVELIAHDNQKDDLIVKYNNGQVYAYQGVTQDVFSSLNGRSTGSWLHTNIKGAYSYRNVTGVTDIRKATDMEVVMLVDKLEHHHATTVGLWATDRPDLIVDKREVMFQINSIFTK